MLRPMLLAAAFAAVLFAFWRGYGLGYDAALASVERDISTARRAAFDAADLASRKEAARLATETQRADLARQLETAADADPDADRLCLGADSVRRLKAY